VIVYRSSGVEICGLKSYTMTRIEIERALTDLNGLVLQGKSLDAFEKYYHNDVSMQENSMAPTVGKKANYAREVEFYGNITDFRGATIKGMGVGDDISFVIWHYDYTHKDWGVRNYSQVSVQHWKDGKIIMEKFVYGD
jgi:hypothetical protein